MKIYLLSNCDEWKNLHSSRSYWCGTNPAKLYFVIKKGIEDGTFHYRRYEDSKTSQEQAEDFLYDLHYFATNHEERIEMIHTFLDYGILQVLPDNDYC